MAEGKDSILEREKETIVDHDVRHIPEAIYPYSSGVRGGLLGGLAMIPVALIYGLISGRGIWYPVNLIAATLILAWQQTTVAQLVQFYWNGLIVGMLIHLCMSVLLGLIFAIMMPALPRSPIFWAFVIGPVLWAGAVYAGLPLLNPIMAQYIDLPSFAIANIAYSLVLGIVVTRTQKVNLNSPASAGFRSWW